MNSTALPLKTKSNEQERTPISLKQSSVLKAEVVAPNDISSPHELTAFVETLLEQIEDRFDKMATQLLDKMTQMFARVDALEEAIQDIINGDISVPQSPANVPGTPGARRSDSGGS